MEAASGGSDVELLCKTLQVEHKLFYFDLKENPRGRYLKISEKTSATRSTIIVPDNGIVWFHEIFNYYVNTVEQEAVSKELQLDTKAPHPHLSLLFFSSLLWMLDAMSPFLSAGVLLRRRGEQKGALLEGTASTPSVLLASDFSVRFYSLLHRFFQPSRANFVGALNQTPRSKSAEELHCNDFFRLLQWICRTGFTAIW